MTEQTRTTEDRIKDNRRFTDFVNLRIDTVTETLEKRNVNFDVWLPGKGEVELTVKPSDANKAEIKLNYKDNQLTGKPSRFDQDFQAFLTRFFSGANA